MLFSSCGSVCAGHVMYYRPTKAPLCGQRWCLSGSFRNRAGISTTHTYTPPGRRVGPHQAHIRVVVTVNAQYEGSSDGLGALMMKVTWACLWGRVETMGWLLQYNITYIDTPCGRHVGVYQASPVTEMDSITNAVNEDTVLEFDIVVALCVVDI